MLLIESLFNVDVDQVLDHPSPHQICDFHLVARLSVLFHPIPLPAAPFQSETIQLIQVHLFK